MDQMFGQAPSTGLSGERCRGSSDNHRSHRHSLSEAVAHDAPFFIGHLTITRHHRLVCRPPRLREETFCTLFQLRTRCTRSLIPRSIMRRFRHCLSFRNIAIASKNKTTRQSGMNTVSAISLYIFALLGCFRHALAFSRNAMRKPLP